MLAAGASTSAPAGSAPIEWIEADASSWVPAIEPVDVVISRFGVMFFDDPVAAFTNVAQACRPGGRLCVVTWDRRDRSELFQVPHAATVEVLERRGLPVADLPLDDGAFSLGDPEVVATVHALRGEDDRPFDVVAAVEDGQDPAAFAAAGATWLLTDSGPGMSLDTARGVIRAGPPR